MAIEKMVLLKVVGSLENMDTILKGLIFCENAHLNLNVENSSSYTNYLAIHQYESEIVGSPVFKSVDPSKIIHSCNNCLGVVEDLSLGLGLELKIDKKFLMENNYSLEDAYKDLEHIRMSIGKKVENN